MIAKDMPTFQSFELPKWEVITPHTQHRLLIKSMLVQQEEALKSSSLSTTKMLDLINKTVYDCLDSREAPFDTVDGFMKNLTLADREALIYGLIVSSYGEEQDFNVTCNACSKNFTEKASLTQNVDIKLYEDKEPILKKKVDVTLPVSKYTVQLQMPTLWDEYVFANSRGVSPDVLRKADDYLVVKQLNIPAVVDPKKPDEVKTLAINNIFEIYSYMRNMSPRDRKTIYSAWKENFGEYGLKIVIGTVCPHCGNRSDMYISMINELFRLSQ